MSYNPSLHTATNKPLGLLGKSTDARSYFYDESTFTYRPYASVIEALAYLNTSSIRTGHFSIYITIAGNTMEYWFKDGTTDEDLIIKSYFVSDTPVSGGGLAFSTGGAFTQLNLKVDKTTTVNGYALSSNIIVPASAVPQNSLNRFVTDSQITYWNAKQQPLGFNPENIANKNIPGGYAGIGLDGYIPPIFLPGYVDDVIEVANYAALPAVGSSDKIYLTIDTAKIYRWGGSVYVEISPSPGTTDDVPEGASNLYYTNARARASITFTTTGTSGAATYNPTTGALNVPNYTPDLSGYVDLTTNQDVYGTKTFLGNSPAFTGLGALNIGLKRNASTDALLINFGTTTGSIIDWYLGMDSGATNFVIKNSTGAVNVLSLNKSTNAATFVNSITSTAFVTSGGSSSQVVLGDGTLGTYVGTNFWQRSGTTLSPATANDRIQYSSNSASIALQISTTNATAGAISGVGIDGFGVQGQVSGTGIAGAFTSNTTSNPTVQIENQNASGIALAVIGAASAQVVTMSRAGVITASSKVNVGSPSGTTGALNTGQDGVFSYRNGDATRFVRFNTSGTFNDFLSTGAKLVMNFGFSGTVQNISMFEGSAAGNGIFYVGSNTATDARVNIKGKSATSADFVIKAFNSSDIELFSVRNDGVTRIATTNTLYVGGNLGVGASPVSDVNILAGTIVNSATSSIFESRGSFGSSVTTGYSFRSSPVTVASSFTMTNIIHYGVTNISLGGSSAVTNQYGVYVNDLTSATNNYGIYSAVSSGSNKYNLYMAGTAENYLGGALTGTSATFKSTTAYGTVISDNTGTTGGGYFGARTNGVSIGYFGTDGAFTGTATNDHIVLYAETGKGIKLYTNSATVAVTISSAQAVRFNTYGAGTITSDASGNLTAVSDMTLKVLDSYYTNGLSALRGITPINHYWTKESGLDTKNLYTGFSAQNIQESIPEAVGKMANGKLTLQDRPIMATVVNAIKELDNTGGKALQEALIRIEELENKLKGFIN
jgi:hypothetical protein